MEQKITLFLFFLFLFQSPSHTFSFSHTFFTPSSQPPLAAQPPLLKMCDSGLAIAYRNRTNSNKSRRGNKLSKDQYGVQSKENKDFQISEHVGPPWPFPIKAKNQWTLNPDWCFAANQMGRKSYSLWQKMRTMMYCLCFVWMDLWWFSVCLIAWCGLCQRDTDILPRQIRGIEITE